MGRNKRERVCFSFYSYEILRWYYLTQQLWALFKNFYKLLRAYCPQNIHLGSNHCSFQVWMTAHPCSNSNVENLLSSTIFSLTPKLFAVCYLVSYTSRLVRSRFGTHWTLRLRTKKLKQSETSFVWMLATKTTKTLNLWQNGRRKVNIVFLVLFLYGKRPETIWQYA